MLHYYVDCRMWIFACSGCSTGSTFCNPLAAHSDKLFSTSKTCTLHSHAGHTVAHIQHPWRRSVWEARAACALKLAPQFESGNSRIEKSNRISIIIIIIVLNFTQTHARTQVCVCLAAKWKFDCKKWHPLKFKLSQSIRSFICIQQLHRGRKIIRLTRKWTI